MITKLCVIDCSIADNLFYIYNTLATVIVSVRISASIIQEYNSI